MQFKATHICGHRQRHSAIGRRDIAFDPPGQAAGLERHGAKLQLAVRKTHNAIGADHAQALIDARRAGLNRIGRQLYRPGATTGGEAPVPDELEAKQRDLALPNFGRGEHVIDPRTVKRTR